MSNEIKLSNGRIHGEHEPKAGRRMVACIRQELLNPGQMAKFASGTIYKKSDKGGLVRVNPKPVSKKRGKRAAVREIGKMNDVRRTMIDRAAAEAHAALKTNRANEALTEVVK